MGTGCFSVVFLLLICGHTLRADHFDEFENDEEKLNAARLRWWNFLNPNVNHPNKKTTLKFVAIVFRHGDRAPAYIFPNNPNKVEKWPQQTLSWLTESGAKHSYSVGQFIRYMYDGFIDRNYKHKQLKIWSSNKIRTVMSANVMMDALFDTQGAFWYRTHNSKYQPVPVMSAGTVEEDKLIHLSKPCPRKEELQFHAFGASTTAQEINNKYKVEFEAVKNLTGMSDVRFGYTSFIVADNLKCDEAYGLPLPDWYKGAIKTALLEADDLLFKYYSFGDELKRLTGGPLLKTIMESMTERVNADSEEKVHLYSGHDTTLSALMNAMDMFDDKRPGFASSLYMELHKVNDSFYVKLIYKRSYAHHAQVVTDWVNGCTGELCLFDTFKEAVKSGIPDDWDKECEETRRKKRDTAEEYHKMEWHV